MNSTRRTDALVVDSVKLDVDRSPFTPSSACSSGLLLSVVTGSESSVGVDGPSEQVHARTIKLPLRAQDLVLTEVYKPVAADLSDPLGPAEVGRNIDGAVGGDMKENGGRVATQKIQLEEKKETEETEVYGELLRARDAWRDAEGELARSQAERDELRMALRSVRDPTSWLRCCSERVHNILRLGRKLGTVGSKSPTSDKLAYRMTCERSPGVSKDQFQNTMDNASWFLATTSMIFGIKLYASVPFNTTLPRALRD